MKQRLLKIKALDDLELDGILYEPDENVKKIVVHVHGLGGSFYENKFVNFLGELYSSKNIAFLTFNNRGTGFLTDMIKRDEIVTVGAVNEVFTDCVLDIEGAINYVKSLGYDDVILSGHSYGCNKVIYSYERVKDIISNIILMAPCDIPIGIKGYLEKKNFNYDKYLDEAREKYSSNDEILFPLFSTNTICARTFIDDFTVGSKNDFFRYNHPLEIVDILKAISIPINIIFGDEDECMFTSTEENIVEFFNSNIDKYNIQVIEGADHHYNECFEALKDCILNVLGNVINEYEKISDGCLMKWHEGFELNDEVYKQVSGYVFNDFDQLLIVKNGDNWTIPGGHPETGESKIDTLNRELLEEGCVTLKDISYLGAVEVVDNEEVYYQLRYVARVKDELEFVSEWEINERKFINIEELDKYIKWANSRVFIEQINSIKL